MSTYGYRIRRRQEFGHIGRVSREWKAARTAGQRSAIAGAVVVRELFAFIKDIERTATITELRVNFRFFRDKYLRDVEGLRKRNQLLADRVQELDLALAQSLVRESNNTPNVLAVLRELEGIRKQLKLMTTEVRTYHGEVTEAVAQRAPERAAEGGGPDGGDGLPPDEGEVHQGEVGEGPAEAAGGEGGLPPGEDDSE